jgi:hypothetical protein
MRHPTPWRVQYLRKLPKWHPQCLPRIVDAAGELVVDMPVYVDHPGEYDAAADETAKRIVATMNASSYEIREDFRGQVAFADIVDECAFAVACCYDHYCDEGLSNEGIACVRAALAEALPESDSGIAYRECGVGRYFRHRIAGWGETDTEILTEKAADEPPNTLAS